MNEIHEKVYNFNGEMDNDNLTGGLPESLYPNFILLQYNNNNFISLMGNDFVPIELLVLPLILFLITKAFTNYKM
jgi:hypothetical protein